MAITKYSDISSYVNTIYEQAVLVAREMNLMTNLVTNYSGTGFMARVLSQRATVSAEAVSDGVDYSAATTFSLSTSSTLTPSEVIAQVVLTDQDMETDPMNAQAQASRELGEAVATKIDKDLCTAFASLSTDKGPGASSNATIATIAAAQAVLRASYAPNPHYVVLHPYAWYDIWTELGQPAATKAMLGDVANEALRQYNVGSFIGSQWFTTANITPDSSDDAVQAVFNPAALAFDSRRAPRLETERDASLRALELNMTAGYATGLGPRPTWGVKYTSDAAAP